MHVHHRGREKERERESTHVHHGERGERDFMFGQLTGLLTSKPRLLLPECPAHPAECVLELVTPLEEEERDPSSLSPYLMSHRDRVQGSWNGNEKKMSMDGTVIKIIHGI